MTIVLAVVAGGSLLAFLTPQPATRAVGASSRRTWTAVTMPPWLGPAAPGVVGSCLLLMGSSVFTAVVTGVSVAGAIHLRRRSERAAAERRRREALPETIELIMLSLGAGRTLVSALELVAASGPPTVRSTFAAVVDRCRHGERRRDVLGALAFDLGPAYRPLVDVLILGERHGAPLTDLLERLRSEASAARRRAAEERARRAPVALLAPLVVCGLPAVLIGTIVPLVLVALGRIELPS